MTRKIKILIIFLFLLGGWGLWQEPDQIQAKSAKNIYRELGQNLCERKSSFQVETNYNSTARFIVKAINGRSTSKYYKVFFLAGKYYDQEDDFEDGDYAWGNVSDVYCYYGSGALHFDAQYLESRKKGKKVTKLVKKQAEKIQASCQTNYQRIWQTYCYIAKTVKYDHRKNPYYSAWGGLVKGKTVCNGYALICYRLLNQMGIPCRFVTGKIKDGKKWYLHAWNIVEIDGKWYNLDSCQDDWGKKPYTDYFLKTDKYFSKDHKRDSFYRTKSFKKKYPMSKKNYKAEEN
ncbi:MAG: lasso peptide biosynthesis protein [Eubacterium sp.]|nr:lasso peptide biosynthesis protein [Eubacterium sp.]